MPEFGDKKFVIVKKGFLAYNNIKILGFLTYG